MIKLTIIPELVWPSGGRLSLSSIAVKRLADLLGPGPMQFTFGHGAEHKHTSERLLNPR